MSRTRVYIKPFDDDGNYASDFIEVTNDVDSSSIGSIKKEIDSTEYGVGVFKFSNIKLTLLNDTGKYSNVNVAQSIFRTKRTDSIVKITWSPNTDDAPLAGQHVLDGSEDVTIFEGILSDEATRQSIKDQKITFAVLGYESLLNRIEVPFGVLSAGNTLGAIILNSLNQSPFSDLVTVSGANISLGTNSVTDSVASLENKTVKEALDELLLLSNSVLWIDNATVYVKARNESASVEYTFYGQASDNGVENIIDISNYTDGLNRVANYWTWQGTTNLSEDNSSTSSYGVRKKEVDSDLITDSAKIDTILDNLRDEFSVPKIELELTAVFNYSLLGINILDKISIDYPTVFNPADSSGLPVWGGSVWGTFYWPIGQWSLTIEPTTYFKVISINHNIKSGYSTFKLREV